MLAALLLAALIADAPAPIHGDFDHDGRPDVAEVVPAGPGFHKLVVRRGAPGQPIAVIDTIRDADLPTLFLELAKPGRRATWCGKGGDVDGPCAPTVVRLRGDTLAYGGRESSEAVAIWVRNRFEVVWLSD